jgi:hypothetical protein
VKLIAEVVPPPGGGFITVIISVPLCIRSLGRSVACSEVELIKLVRREEPFTSTVEPCVKPVPETFNVSELLPAGKLGGVTVPPPGCGFLTVKVNETDVLPSGLVTITYGFPAIAMALAGITAASCVELTMFVDTLFRLKVTCEPCTNPVPNTLRGNDGPPAVVLVREILETDRGIVGGRMESMRVLEVPPPGTPLEGVVTEILIVPWATL